jgi:hypothetical protein
VSNENNRARFFMCIVSRFAPALGRYAGSFSLLANNREENVFIEPESQESGHYLAIKADFDAPNYSRFVNIFLYP